MSITGYRQIMEVDTASSLPIMTVPGELAFAWDTNRHYKFNGTNWIQVATQDEITAAARQAYVTGVLKLGVFSYLAKSASVSGTLTFWITDNGLSTGNAVFTEVEEDGITISPYGTANSYQLSTPVVSADRKKVTANITQTGTVILGLISTVTAANGIDCRAIIMGK